MRGLDLFVAVAGALLVGCGGAQSRTDSFTGRTDTSKQTAVTQNGLTSAGAPIDVSADQQTVVLDYSASGKSVAVVGAPFGSFQSAITKVDETMLVVPPGFGANTTQDVTDSNGNLTGRISIELEVSGTGSVGSGQLVLDLEARQTTTTTDSSGVTTSTTLDSTSYSFNGTKDG